MGTINLGALKQVLKFLLFNIGGKNNLKNFKKVVDRSAQQWYHTNCCGGNAETTEPERHRQSGNHPDDPGTESKKDEKSC